MAPFEDSHNNFVKYTDQQGNLLAAVVRDGTIQAQQVQFGDDSVQTTAGGGAIMQRAVVTISSAQLLALSATPVQLVAAPGAGNFINPIAVTMELKAGGIAYAATGTPEFDIGYLGDIPAQDTFLVNGSQLTQFIESASNSLTQGFLASGCQTHHINTPVQIGLSGGTLITGNGTVNVYILYTIETA